MSWFATRPPPRLRMCVIPHQRYVIQSRRTDPKARLLRAKHMLQPRKWKLEVVCGLIPNQCQRYHDPFKIHLLTILIKHFACIGRLSRMRPYRVCLSIPWHQSSTWLAMKWHDIPSLGMQTNYDKSAHPFPRNIAWIISSIGEYEYPPRGDD